MVETKEEFLEASKAYVPKGTQVAEVNAALEAIHLKPTLGGMGTTYTGVFASPVTESDRAVSELTERVRMLEMDNRSDMIELVLNYVSQQQFPQPEQSYGMLVALALKGKDKVTLKALCPTCGKTYAYQGLCRDYFHQPAPVRDLIP